MRICLLLVLMSLSLIGYSQTTFTFTIPQDVATKQWVEQYVTYKVDSLNRIKPPVSSFPKTPCTFGPELKSVSNISKDYLSFRFNGLNVTSIYWWISVTDGGIPVRYGEVDPKSSTIKISYDTLPTGSYILGISGTKCIGSDTRAFTIKNTL